MKECFACLPKKKQHEDWDDSFYSEVGFQNVVHFTLLFLPPPCIIRNTVHTEDEQIKQPNKKLNGFASEKNNYFEISKATKEGLALIA